MTARPARRRAAVAGAALALALAVPAHAAPVLRVSGGEAVRAQDPFVSAAAAEPEPAPRPRAGAAHAPAAVSAAAARRPTRGERAVRGALRGALARRGISRRAYASYAALYSRARRTRARLRGLRGRELGAVIAQLEAFALRRQLTRSRMPPLFLILRRNTAYWPRLPLPAPRDLITFRGSEMVWEYYPGTGLQLQPLVNFKKANNLHGACVKRTGPCRKATLRRLLRELIATRARRGRFWTWEYYFAFGGGRPPWMSAMAQSTAIVGLARASQLLRDRGLLRIARQGFGAYTTRPPVGVRATGPLGGVHYLQYSFAPRTWIFNAFTQAELGLYDYAQITGERTPRRLFAAAEPELRRELPYSDLGDWSLYSWRGPASDVNYHELLREFMRSACDRFRRDPYCALAKRYRRYQTEPPVIRLLGPAQVTKGRPARVRFTLSKLSAVEIRVTMAGRVGLDRIQTFSRGTGSFAWTPKATGTYSIRLSAKELRTGAGLRGADAGSAESLP